MGDKQVAFKLTEERLAELGKEAERKGQTLAGLVRQWVYEKLDELSAE